MINLSLKKMFFFLFSKISIERSKEAYTFQNQKGAAILLITFVLFTAAVLGIFYAANFEYLRQKTSINAFNNNQAFEAAEAGFQYALAFLNTNTNTVTGSPSGGFINYSISTNTLGNNSTFSVVFTNPTANNYKLLTVTSTGQSADGTATRIIVQQVQMGPPRLIYAVTTRTNFTAALITTINATYGINAGGSILAVGILNSQNNFPNDTVLANKTPDALFSEIFGKTKAQMKSQATVYTNPLGLGIPWGSLSGIVWVDNTITLGLGVNTIGSPSNPVLLIINGNLLSTVSFTVHGLLYVMGSLSPTLFYNVNGAVVAENSILAPGISTVTYNSSIIGNWVIGTYIPVPGSWRDF